MIRRVKCRIWLIPVRIIAGRDPGERGGGRGGGEGAPILGLMDHAARCQFVVIGKIYGLP